MSPFDAVSMARRLLGLGAHAKPVLRRLGLDRQDGLAMRAARAVLAPAGREVAVKVEGLSMVLPPDSPSAPTYRLGWYEPQVREWVSAYLQPGMGFADGGAFAGYYTLLAATRVGPGGQVWAFEPDPLSRRYLDRNVRANDLGQVEVLDLAIASQPGQLGWVDKGLEWGCLSDEPGGHRVQVTSLDAFFTQRSWPRVDLVKLDLETREPPALRGMAELVRRNPSVHVVIEVLPAGSGGWDASHHQELVAACRAAGLVNGRVIERGMAAFQLPDFPTPPPGTLYNVVMSR